MRSVLSPPLFCVLLLALLAHSAVGWSTPWEQQRREQQEREKGYLRAKLDAASATINQAAGVFKQVNKAGEPIYKHVSGGDWGMRQISTTGQAIYKPSYFGSAVNGLGKVFWVGAVAMEAANVAEAASKDLKEGKITNTVHASSKAVGGWTGAAYGASAGAAMFSFIPVVGTLAGGIAGGVIGAYTGSFAGEVVATVAVGQT